jgi:hypothetical protein
MKYAATSAVGYFDQTKISTIGSSMQLSIPAMSGMNYSLAPSAETTPKKERRTTGSRRLKGNDADRKTVIQWYPDSPTG